MDLVVDANVLFSALIKEGFSHNLFFNENLHLFTPEYIFTELEKHKKELLNKTEKAEEITPDPDDMAYFALALKLNCAIWSNDKKLKPQDKVEVYNTHELDKIIKNS